MKILSVYQAHTKQADGTLPECNYVSVGCAATDMALFEAAPDLLAALKDAQCYVDPDSPIGARVRAAIAKAEAPWSNKPDPNKGKK